MLGAQVPVRACFGRMVADPTAYVQTMRVRMIVHVWVLACGYIPCCATTAAIAAAAVVPALSIASTYVRTFQVGAWGCTPGLFTQGAMARALGLVADDARPRT